MSKRVLIFCFCFVPALLVWQPPSFAQITIVPGSAVRGADVFREKECVTCHKFDGAGGTTGPDLAQDTERIRTPMQLATALWNHAPRMWRAQEVALPKGGRPLLDSMETSDLFAYFYSLAYSKSGNATRGAGLFEKKGCANCHAKTITAVSDRRRSGLLEPSIQSPISTWAVVDDPLVWAERMWNHAGKVYRETSITGSPWPQFSSGDMADLLSYLRNLPETRSRNAVFQPGDPEQGRMTFERSCESCHSFGGRTTESKIDLLKTSRPDDLISYVAAMWNHAPVMDARAASMVPVLGPGDMSNLVAYLFAKRYFDEEGNVERGARIFKSKNCVVCHEQQRRPQFGAPDLALATERYSPITVSAAIWRHGPLMFQVAQNQKLSWPKFKPSEMSDLISFLNSRLISRIARH